MKGVVNIKFLAIDQSTDNIGLAFFEGSDLKEYRFFQITKLLGNVNIESRINMVKKIMVKMIEKYDIECVILEDIFLKISPKGIMQGYNAFKGLSELLGVLIDSLFEMNIRFFVVKPSVWRSTCKIKGKNKIQKDNAIKFVKDKFGIDVKVDTAEAIAIGYHASKKIIPHIE